MAFEAQMRVGSIEIAAALFAVAFFAARPRVRVAADLGRLQPMRVALQFSDGGGERTYLGRPPFELGRAGGNDVVLHDPEVSRSHARFESRGGVVYVEDLHSSNGTYLNGRRVGEAIEVRAGDRIDVGTTRVAVVECEPWT